MVEISQLPGEFNFRFKKGDYFPMAFYIKNGNALWTLSAYFLDGESKVTIPIVAKPSQEGDAVGSFRISLDITDEVSGAIQSNVCEWYLKYEISGMPRTLVNGLLLLGNKNG